VNTRVPVGGFGVRALALLVALMLSASTSVAAVRETFAFTTVNSNGLQNAASNSVRTFNAVGGYGMGRVNITGTLTELNANTFASDAKILVTAPNGTSIVVHAFPRNGPSFGNLSMDLSLSFGALSNAAGTWTLRFFEVVDNGGAASVDARWDVTVRITDEPPAPPATTNMGVLVAPGFSVPSASINSSGFVMYRFTLERNVDAALGRYLDIVAGNSMTSPDTELALFDSAGQLLVTDDDTGSGFAAQLSFGMGTRPAYPNGQPLDGRNGTLPMGTYYLAVGLYDLQYTAQPWGIGFIGASGGLSFDVVTNVPPGTDCTPPVITAHPESLLLAPGGGGAMSVSLDAGPGAASYQWRHNGAALSDGGPVSGTATATLTFTGVDTPNNGVYDVVVTKQCGSVVSDGATLWVTCSSDYNGDGDIGTDQDIEAFFACLGGNCCATCGGADFNGDGDIGTDQDIESFFRVLGGGAC